MLVAGPLPGEGFEMRRSVIWSVEHTAGSWQECSSLLRGFVCTLPNLAQRAAFHIALSNECACVNPIVQCGVVEWNNSSGSRLRSTSSACRSINVRLIDRRTDTICAAILLSQQICFRILGPSCWRLAGSRLHGRAIFPLDGVPIIW